MRQALITSTPLPSHCKRIQYCPATTYGYEPPPPVHVEELLPRDEESYKYLRQEERKQAEERTATGPKKGFFASLKKSVKGTSKNIGGEFSDISVSNELKGSSEAIRIANEESFRAHFRLPWEEKLWDCFHCKVIVSQGFNRTGKCYISDSYFSFSSTYRHEYLAFMIPLKEIVSFRSAVESGKKHTKQLVAADVPAETIRGLIIYTSDHAMHRFYHFHPDSRGVYSVLDSAWTAAKNSLLPLPTSIPLTVMFPARPGQHIPQETLESQGDNNWNVNNTQVVPSLEKSGSGLSEGLTNQTTTTTTTVIDRETISAVPIDSRMSETRTIDQGVPIDLQNQKISPTETANVSEQLIEGNQVVTGAQSNVNAYQG